jgi:UPF0755 protein
MPNGEGSLMENNPPVRHRRSPLGCFVILIVVVIVSGALAAAGFILIGLWPGDAHPDRTQANPNLSQAQWIYLNYYLSQNEDRLRQPAGTGTEPVAFTIAPGSGAAGIAENLAAAGLLSDTELFLNYLTFYGLDGGLVAGDYRLTPQMTIPELAEAIGTGRSRTLALNFLPGWRSEEMAHYLDVTRPAQIDADQFLSIVQNRRGINGLAYSFLNGLPSGATLEGYLFPSEYPITIDTTSTALVDMMLAEFDRQVTPEMRQSFGIQGLSLREAVILASIIEKEAVLADEKPVMAGVFLNRLRTGMPLQADPTVQYARGYDATRNTWWKSPLDAEDLQINSPYNTYQVGGLPPGPISNPGLGSLMAVASPSETGYLYFVLDCTAGEPGRHVFSVTYEEHVANVQRCR